MIRWPARRFSVGLGALVLLAGLILARPASANGGTVQVSRETAGPFEVTVWTDPSPIRIGTIDVSVMVELPGGSVVQDAQVSVTAGPMSDFSGAETYEATHDRATNKLFYAADIPVARTGPIHVRVLVAGIQGDGDVSFRVEVEEPGLLDRPLTRALVGTAVAIGVLAWAVQRRKRTRRR